MKRIFTTSIVFLLSLVFCALPVITFSANFSEIQNSPQLHNKSIHLNHSLNSRSSKKVTYILSLPMSDTPKQEQAELIKSLDNILPYTLLHEYTHSCNAIAIEVSAYNARALQSLPSNVNVFNAEQNVIPVRQLEVISINSKYELKPSEYREIEFTGKNVKVGMIDTGIDLHHGDFSFSDTNLPKIVNGVDIADNDDDVQDLRIYPHGTHVGGIIAGNNPNLPIRKGVAPDASLLVYKVFGDNGSLNLEDIIKAIDLAIEDKCHVVNMSLGYSTVEEAIPSIDKDNPMYQAIEKASEEGVTVCAAAGNYGARTKERPWQILAPCIFDNTIGVAASDDRLCCTLTCRSDENPTPYSCNVQRLLYTPTIEDNFFGNNLLDCGYGSVEEINSPDTVAYAVLHRGPKDNPIPFLDKLRNVSNATGFLGCIIVDENNNLNSTFSVFETPDTTTLPKERLLPTVVISQNLYEMLQKFMTRDSFISLMQVEKSVVSDFTCTGPCGDGDYGSFKPDVCAPGKQISSAALSKRKGKDEYIDRYEIWEGTSMATACTSGVVALVKEAHPNWTPYQIKCALMNSADVLMNPQTNQPFSYFLQGSGQINAKHAINTPLLLSPPSHQRLVELDSSYQQTFTIKNMSNEIVKATPTCSINTYYNRTYGSNGLFHIDPVFAEFDQQEIELKPTDDKTIEVTFHTSSLLFQKPMIQGQLVFTLEYENESVEDRPAKLHIPFILHSESISPVYEGITNTHIIPSVQSYKTPSTLQFDVYSGTKLQYPTAYLLLNTAEQLRIYVADKDDTPLGDIYYGEWVLPGDYRIRWDQKNLEGEYFLPNGEYKVYVEMNGRSYSRNAFGRPEVKSDPCTYLLDEITIEDSPISNE